MRNILTIIAMAILLSACQKPYEKAVEEYINANFNDPSSYERVELSEPVAYTGIQYAKDELLKQAREEGWPADTTIIRASRLRDKLISNGLNPDTILWNTVEHTYRATNSMGAKILKKEKWILNEDCTEVMFTE